MGVKLYMPSAFDRLKREGDIIGRLVVEYGELEWTLCLLVSHVIQDLDVAVKALYRSRGESQRVKVADALIRNRICTKVSNIYEDIISKIRVCLKIRNQYAHSNWISLADGRLGYVDIEEMANKNSLIDLNNLSVYVLDISVIGDQARFFCEVAQNLNYLCMEVQYLNGVTDVSDFHYIPKIEMPKSANILNC